MQNETRVRPIVKFILGKLLVLVLGPSYDVSGRQVIMILSTNVHRTRNDNISVACADCPASECGKENVVARVASARSGFNSSADREITCKRCAKVFKVPEDALLIRRYPREQIDLEYGLDSLAWME